MVWGGKKKEWFWCRYMTWALIEAKSPIYAFDYLRIRGKEVINHFVNTRKYKHTHTWELFFQQFVKDHFPPFFPSLPSFFNVPLCLSVSPRFTSFSSSSSSPRIFLPKRTDTQKPMNSPSLAVVFGFFFWSTNRKNLLSPPPSIFITIRPLVQNSIHPKINRIFFFDTCILAFLLCFRGTPSFFLVSFVKVHSPYSFVCTVYVSFFVRYIMYKEDSPDRSRSLIEISWHFIFFSASHCH